MLGFTYFFDLLKKFSLLETVNRFLMHAVRTYMHGALNVQCLLMYV